MVTWTGGLEGNGLDGIRPDSGIPRSTREQEEDSGREKPQLRTWRESSMT